MLDHANVKRHFQFHSLMKKHNGFLCLVIFYKTFEENIFIPILRVNTNVNEN